MYQAQRLIPQCNLLRNKNVIIDVNNNSMLQNDIKKILEKLIAKMFLQFQSQFQPNFPGLSVLWNYIFIWIRLKTSLLVILIFISYLEKNLLTIIWRRWLECFPGMVTLDGLVWEEVCSNITLNTKSGSDMCQLYFIGRTWEVPEELVCKRWLLKLPNGLTTRIKTLFVFQIYLFVIEISYARHILFFRHT